MPALITTQKTTANREMATALERTVARELEDRYGLFIASDDSFDLTEDNQLVLVNGAGDSAFLPFKTSPRIATYVAAAIYLRDADGAA